MNDLVAVLYFWSLWLSAELFGYDPQPQPPVRLVAHEWLVEHACNKRECKVIGWYNDTGTVFMDERFMDNLESSPLSQSILVHEFVHYLQHKSGWYPPNSCEWQRDRELEAYAVSDTFLVNNGWIPGPHPQTYAACAMVIR